MERCVLAIDRRWELFADGWIVRWFEFDSGRRSSVVHRRRRRRCRCWEQSDKLRQGSIGVSIVHRRYTGTDSEVKPTGQHHFGGDPDAHEYANTYADLDTGTWRPRHRKEPLRRQRRLQEWLWHGGESPPFFSSSSTRVPQTAFFFF